MCLMRVRWWHDMFQILALLGFVESQRLAVVNVDAECDSGDWEHRAFQDRSRFGNMGYKDWRTVDSSFRH